MTIIKLKEATSLSNNGLCEGVFVRTKDFAFERKIFLISHVVNCPIVWHDTFSLREKIKIN